MIFSPCFSNMPKKTRQKWDKDAMQAALEAVKSKKLGFKKAAMIYKVPRTILFRLSKLDCSASDAVMKKLGRPPTLPPHLEDQLVSYLLEMEKRYFGLTRSDVKRLAYQLASINNMSNK